MGRTLIFGRHRRGSTIAALCFLTQRLSVQSTLLFSLVIASAAAVASATCGAEARSWTDSSGRFSIEATLESVDDDVAVLIAKDGRRIRVPLSSLSDADRAHVEAVKNDGSVGEADNVDNVLNALAINTHEQLQRAAEQERFATAVVALYQAFIGDAELSEDERLQASQELEKWKSLASDKAVNYGGSWRKPSEIEELQNEAKRLIEQAKKLVSVNNEALAINTLLRASKVDPESVEADFTLGLLYALVGGHPNSARKHFVVCVRRLQGLGKFADARQRANLVASLNNAAITEVRLGMESTALKHWEEAAEFDSIPRELIQNVGRFSSLASVGIHVDASRALTDRIGRLYAKLAASEVARPYDASKGWFYVPHLGIATTTNDNDADREEQVPARRAGQRENVAASKNLRIFGTGSGFAITPELILTNAHVVKDAFAIGLRINGDDIPNITGQVVEASDTVDLALVKAVGLKAAALSLESEEPRLSSEVRVLGYPEEELLGRTIKVTSGTIAGLPDPHAATEKGFNRMLQLDAVVNPGNSGGPVLLANGNVVGVATLGIHTRQNLSAAVPMSKVAAFLHDAGVWNDETAGVLKTSADEEWEAVVDRAARSTYQLLIYGLPDTPVSVIKREAAEHNNDRPKPPPKWNGLEDRWCMHCNGLSHVECPNRDCKSGAIVGRRVDSYSSPTGIPINIPSVTRSRCPTCNGSGRVSCPFCANGFE